MEDEFLIKNYAFKRIPNQLVKQDFIKHGVYIGLGKIIKDFYLSFFKTMLSTYLGDDVTGKEDQLTHFDWNWKTIIKKFEESHNVIIAPFGKHYEYFKEN